MIASLAGRVTAHTAGGLVVTVGGVGLAVQTTPGTRARLRPGDDAQLATTLIVREDALTLYGFESDDERELFELLQTASGVGPKVAQAVLTVHTPDAVRRALATEDLAALTLVPGIGRKGAQRLVLEMKDKVGLVGSAPSGTAVGWRDTLLDALTGLGWTTSQSEEVVSALAAEHPAATEADVPVLLKQALGRMAR
ncbi:MAG TPA: Holliday junction branch migration protein RuvA [Mycobacteriales bacterium]|nr:Holliday junction branch migration protein RuvA [Mycobacteriales bacterium]